MAAPIDDDLTVCRDSGNFTETIPDDQLERLGWVCLPVSRRWRCPNCAQALSFAASPPPSTTTTTP